MAGMGPPPKPAALRQRRNKVAGGAVLPAAGSARPAPALPDRACPCVGLKLTESCTFCDASGVMPWHPIVLEQWAKAWASPMAAEWLDADVHGLFIVADLWDDYWRGNRDRAAEIRLQEQRFGLSSLDRRRLQWEVERVEQAQKRRPIMPGVHAKRSTKDPRAFLGNIKAVK